jgi:hypothetical protein
VGTLPSAIAAGDLNRDGRLDLALADFRSENVWLLMGRGAGAFRRPVGIRVGKAPTAPSAIVIADLNRDGVPDLAVADLRANQLAMLAGAGGGRFRTAVRVPAGPGPSALAAADLTGDGLLDLAVADAAANAVNVVRASRGGGIRVGGALLVDAAPGPSSPR